MKRSARRLELSWSLLLVLAGAANAQLPQPPAPSEPPPAPEAAAASAPWQTLRTAHFRVHYPAAASRFAGAVAARAEAVRAEVIGLVGHAPESVVDVVVGGSATTDPGRALPFREGPRILLHAAPPPSARLESFDDWIAIALARELAPVSHLSRSPRRPAVRFVSRLLPLYPFLLQVPPWVGEAHATMVEDGLACAGRPRRPLHRALLRALATAGRLPPFSDLEGDAPWPGVDHSQLAGAEFLAWLEDRHGRGSLTKVWARMTDAAPHRFAGAAKDVFGAPLDELYRRFVADLEARWPRAAAAAASGVAPPDSSAPALDVWSAPDVAPDGAMVLTLRSPGGPPRLAVLDRTGTERQALELGEADGASEARWLPDGSVLFGRVLSGDDDRRHGDLFRWWPDANRTSRLTTGADLEAATPAPDGAWAVAVESRWGSTALVRVDLDSGAVAPLVAGALESRVDAPRLSPDGRRLAYLRHRSSVGGGGGGAGWRLVVRDLASGAETELGAPQRAALAWPAWSGDGRWIVLTTAAGDSVGVEAWSVAGDGVRRRLTPPAALAFAPAFDPASGELLHLELAPPAPPAETGGVRLRRLAWSPATGETLPAAIAGAPAEGVTCVALDDAIGDSRPYGRGSTTWSSLLSGSASPSALSYTGGWRGGDVIGRWEAVAIAGISEEGVETGGIVSAAWRGWRLPLEFHGYQVERNPSRQPEGVPGLGTTLDVLERGLALESAWKRVGSQRTLGLGAALQVTKLTPINDRTVERYALILRGDGDWTVPLPRAAQLRLGSSLAGAAGWTDSRDWQRYGGGVRAGVSSPAGAAGTLIVDATWSGLAVEHATLPHDRMILGGFPSSLLPTHLDLGRVYEGALPAGTLIGDRWESWRLELGRAATPIRLFGARHRVWSTGAPRGAWLDLAGAEMRLDRDARPIYRLPSSRVRVGVAYVLDEPFADQWMGWAGIAWTL